jgi:ElaB/YqjD/DUF883 family membrane-anchored ribosome-binding protein
LTTLEVVVSGVSADEKEEFMDEITGPEELSEKVKDQTAEVKENAGAAVDQARRTPEKAWDAAKSKLNDLQSLEAFVREKPNPSDIGYVWDWFPTWFALAQVELVLLSLDVP